MKIDLMIWAIKFFELIFPKLAYKLLKMRLLVPEKKVSRWRGKIKVLTINTKFGKVRTFQHGQGKCIWLIHGWSDANQFWPLMQKLAKQGYRCIAIEMPPYNANHDGISLPKWVKAFDLAAVNIDEPTQVITHGLGASVLAHSQWFSRYSSDLTLISPVLDYFASLQCFFRKTKISTHFLNQLSDEVYLTDKVRLTDLNATPLIDQFDGRLSIFYSKSDSSASVDAIHNISQRGNRKIVRFNGEATDRIINSRSLLCAIQVEGRTLDIAI